MWEDHKKRQLGRVKYYHQNEHEIFQYKDKNITEYTEVFAHLNDIEITKDNAFLLRP